MLLKVKTLARRPPYVSYRAPWSCRGLISWLPRVSYPRRREAPSSLRVSCVREQVCQMLFGVSATTCTKIVSGYLGNNQSFYVSGRSGNKEAKETLIPRTRATQILIREFVRGERKQRRRVTEKKQVMEFLVREGVIQIPKDACGLYEKKPHQTALRTTTRCLESFGYSRGRRKGNLFMKPEVNAHRDMYLRTFFNNRAQPPATRLREVMMDESYIHEHYRKNDYSCWDTNDHQDVQMAKAPSKGRRCCFAAAIQGPNPRVEGEPTARDQAGLVPGSVWAFCPQKEKDQHQGDYHKVFDSNFLTWWTDQLLPNLHEPSLIIIDNASYHKAYDETVPKPGRMKKAELVLYATEKSICNDPALLTVAELRPKVTQWIKTNEKLAVEKLAEAQGYKVLFTPAYYWDFQTIELVWALIKGNAGRQYSH